MSRVASEPTLTKPHPPSAGARRPPPDAAAKSNPFDALLDGSSEPPPPPRKNAPPERTQPAATARTPGTAREEAPRIPSGNPPKAGAEQATECADLQQAAAAAGDAIIKDAAAENQDCLATAEGCATGEKAADATPIEAALPSVVTGVPATPPPAVTAQPIAAPLAATSLLDAQPANAAAADGEACAAVEGKGMAAAAGQEIAAADGRALAATEGVDGTRTRGAADSKAGGDGKAAITDSNGSKIANGPKAAGASDATRSDVAAVATAGAEQDNGEEPPDAKAKSDQPRPPVAATGNHDAPPPKPGEALNRQPGTEPPAVEGGKPPVDAAQIARAAHSAGQFGNVIAHAAPAATTAPAAANAPSDVSVPVAGLAVEIAAKVQAGRNRFEIRLDPPELGRIDVRLDIDRSGHVTSRLVVEKVETLDLLRRDAPELERALQQAGLKTSDNGLQFTLRDQPFAGRDQNHPNAARLAVADDDLAPIETVAGGYARSPGRDGGIDIRV